MGLRLGEFLDMLERIEPRDWIYIADSPITLVPTAPDSYRGYYEQLAIGAAADSSPALAKDVLAFMKAALDKTFTGYKGGDFLMHIGTPLWISNYGECSGARVTGLRPFAGIGAWEITWEKDQ